jgi:protein TonB
MTAISLRAAPPVLRFGLSTLASLLLHLAVLVPVSFSLQRSELSPPPVLDVVLAAPMLATKRVEDAPAAADVPPPAAVASSGHLRPEGLPVPPAPTIASKPPPVRQLKGRGLNTALAALAKEEFYPREAIERGIEGGVIVLLTLTATGSVANAEVATSSGHAILDAAALAAVRRISGLPVTQRQVLLPVQFRLN